MPPRERRAFLDFGRRRQGFRAQSNGKRTSIAGAAIGARNRRTADEGSSERVERAERKLIDLAQIHESASAAVIGPPTRGYLNRLGSQLSDAGRRCRKRPCGPDGIEVAPTMCLRFRLFFLTSSRSQALSTQNEATTRRKQRGDSDSTAMENGS